MLPSTDSGRCIVPHCFEWVGPSGRCCHYHEAMILPSTRRPLQIWLARRGPIVRGELNEHGQFPETVESMISHWQHLAFWDMITGQLAPGLYGERRAKDRKVLEREAARRAALDDRGQYS